MFLWAAGGDLATLVRNPALAELVGGIKRWATWLLLQGHLSKVMQGSEYPAVPAHEAKRTCRVLGRGTSIQCPSFPDVAVTASCRSSVMLGNEEILDEGWLSFVTRYS